MYLISKIHYKMMCEEKRHSEATNFWTNKQFTYVQLNNALNKLKNKKAPGYLLLVLYFINQTLKLAAV